MISLQFALEPLWKLYEVCSPGAGADVRGSMTKAAKSLHLSQVPSFYATCIPSVCQISSVHPVFQAVIFHLHVLLNHMKLPFMFVLDASITSTLLLKTKIGKQM